MIQISSKSSLPIFMIKVDWMISLFKMCVWVCVHKQARTRGCGCGCGCACVITSNRITYEECFTFNNMNTKVIYLCSPSLKWIKCVINSKFTRIWLIRIPIANKIDRENPVWFCKNFYVFPPMIAVHIE
jgi:hypothetical protein